jgi:hypothetical protein
MNFKKTFILKIVALLFISLLPWLSSYSQIKPYTKLEAMNFKYGAVIELKRNQPIQFEDGLKIVLTHFSHKLLLPEGGPQDQQATAYLSLSKGDISEEISLRAFGIGDTRYESLVWKKYEFQLKSLNYDDSIKIIVNKRHN